MKTSKRLLSVIMAVFMVIGLVSVGFTAFAAPLTLQQLINAASDGDTVVLPTHRRESVVIENKDITLDLNTKSLDGAYGQSTITVKNSDVTIKNGQVYSYFAQVSSEDMIKTVADSAYSKPTINIISGNVSIYGLFVNGMQVRVPTTTNTYSYVPVSSAVFVNKDASLTVEKCGLVGFEWGLANGYGSHITIIDGAFAGFDKGIKHEAEVAYNSTLTSRVSSGDYDVIAELFPFVADYTQGQKDVAMTLLNNRVIGYVKNAVTDVETTYDDGTLTVVAEADLSNVVAAKQFSYKWIPDNATVGATTKTFEYIAGTDTYVAVFNNVPETAAGSVDTLDVNYRLWLGLNPEENAIISEFVSTVKGAYADLGPFLVDGYEELVETYNDYIDVFAGLYYDFDTLAAQAVPGNPSKKFGDIEAFKNLQKDLYLIGGETMYARIAVDHSDYEYIDNNISAYFGIEPGQPKILDELEALKVGLDAVDLNDYVELLSFFYDHIEDIADIVALADEYGSMLVADLNSEMASDIITALAGLGGDEITDYVDLAEEMIGYIGEANDFIVHGLGLGEVVDVIDYIDTNRAELEGYAADVIYGIENLENYFIVTVDSGWLKLYEQTTTVEYQALKIVEANVAINGTGKVEYASEFDSGETINGAKAEYAPNTDVILTAVETSATVEFLYWVNSDTNRIISTNPQYTISTNIDTRIEAVFNDSEFGYQVAYTNNSGDISGVEFYDPSIDSSVYVTTSIPSMPRYSFVSWPYATNDGFGNKVISIADLAAHKSPFAGSLKTSAFDEVSDKYENAIVPVQTGSGNYIVVPEYDLSGTVRITYFDGATMKVANYGLYANASITAAPGNFSYWVNDRGEIASLYSTFEFKAVADNTYTAVYNAPVVPDAVITIAGTYRDAASEQVTFYAERSSKYTVKKNGIVLTFDPAVAADDAAFVPGATNVLTGTAKYNTLTGNYAVTKNSYTGNPIYARGYIEIEYAGGQRVTLYSDVVSYWD